MLNFVNKQEKKINAKKLHFLATYKKIKFNS